MVKGRRGEGVDPRPEVLHDPVEEVASDVTRLGRRGTVRPGQGGGELPPVVAVQLLEGALQETPVQRDQLVDGADVRLPARRDGAAQQAGELAVEAGEGDEVGERESEHLGENRGLPLGAAPLPALLHPYVDEEFEPDGPGDVLGPEAARGAMLAQGAGVADEFAGRTPQHTCESGEFMLAGGHDAAFPGDHVVGRDVRQSVRDPHPVRDMFGAHPEGGTESAGGVGVEGRGRRRGRWGRNCRSAHAPQARGARRR